MILLDTNVVSEVMKPQPDGQIASIAQAHGFAVATRNIDHYADCGIELVNPFAT